MVLKSLHSAYNDPPGLVNANASTAPRPPPATAARVARASSALRSAALPANCGAETRGCQPPKALPALKENEVEHAPWNSGT